MEITITVNLKGSLKGPKRHESYQSHSVTIPGKNRLVITKDILHTDREEFTTVRKVNISENVMKEWMNNAPSWEKPKRWSLMSQNQKIKSYLHSFDEGHGVSFEISTK